MAKKKTRTREILAALDRMYPFDGKCFLDFDEPWQLLFATILSAQCTDAQVNKTTPKLFAAYPSLEAFAAADISGIEEAIRSTGFYRTKAAHLKESASRLLNEFGGELPSDVEALTSLSGVGRKTANVVRGHIFKIPSIVVDTHVKRVSTRLGLAKHSDPAKIEFELMDTLPVSHWIAYNQQIITHGRRVCTAKKPYCDACGLAAYCEGGANTIELPT